MRKGNLTLIVLLLLAGLTAGCRAHRDLDTDGHVITNIPGMR